MKERDIKKEIKSLVGGLSIEKHPGATVVESPEKTQEIRLVVQYLQELGMTRKQQGLTRELFEALLRVKVSSPSETKSHLTVMVPRSLVFHKWPLILECPELPFEEKEVCIEANRDELLLASSSREARPQSRPLNKEAAQAFLSELFLLCQARPVIELQKNTDEEWQRAAILGLGDKNSLLEAIEPRLSGVGTIQLKVEV